MLNKILMNANKAAIAWQKRIVEDFMEWSNTPKVAEEEFMRRIAICEACDRFDNSARKCTLCGCFMDVKASLAEYPFSTGKAKRTVQCADATKRKW